MMILFALLGPFIGYATYFGDWSVSDRAWEQKQGYSGVWPSNNGGRTVQLPADHPQVLRNGSAEALPDFFYREAELAFQNADWALAEKKAKVGLELGRRVDSSRNTDLTVLSGRALIARGRYAEALGYLKPLEHGYWDGRLFAEIAFCRAKVGDLTGARKSYFDNGMEEPGPSHVTNLRNSFDERAFEGQLTLTIGSNFLEYGKGEVSKRLFQEAKELLLEDPKAEAFIKSSLNKLAKRLDRMSIKEKKG